MIGFILGFICGVVACLVGLAGISYAMISSGSGYRD